MKYLKKLYFFVGLTVIALLGITTSCTELDENVHSSLPSDEFYQNERQVIQGAGRSFTHLQGGISDLYGFWGLQVVPTDQSIIPYRVTNLWWDGGVWIDLHRHDFYANLNYGLGAAWSFLFEGVSTVNQSIYQTEKSPVEFDGKDKIVAELKVLRAWFYLQAIDLFGNVPISTDFQNAEQPTQSSRQEVFDFIETELTQNIDISVLDPYPNAENYGRPTQAMANIMLAELYLNAEEWTGTAHWDETIAAADAIINSGSPLQLEPNYLDNFSPDNEGSRENIFVVPYDRNFTPQWGNALQINHYTLHTLSQQTFDMTEFCWDGIAAMENYYKSFEEEDDRINMWLEGPQYSSSGEPLMLSEDEQLNYRPEVRSLAEDGNRALLDDGVRFQKYAYEFGLQPGQSMSNDWVLYRYADALMMKAEALMRKNGGTATPEAVNLVNQVRERAYGNSSHNYTPATLTMDTLLAELGREFAWRASRRTDMIRFGKWTEAWFEKPATQDYKKLFPIPIDVLNVNSNFEQNPGY